MNKKESNWRMTKRWHRRNVIHLNRRISKRKSEQTAREIYGTGKGTQKRSTEKSLWNCQKDQKETTKGRRREIGAQGNTIALQNISCNSPMTPLLPLSPRRQTMQSRQGEKELLRAWKTEDWCLSSKSLRAKTRQRIGRKHYCPLRKLCMPPLLPTTKEAGPLL